MWLWGFYVPHFLDALFTALKILLLFLQMRSKNSATLPAFLMLSRLGISVPAEVRLVRLCSSSFCSVSGFGSVVGFRLR